MKRIITGLATASMLIGLPLVASAHDDDRRNDWRGHEHHGDYHRHKHSHRQRYHAPPVVYHYMAPQPRPWPLNHVDIGFRILF